MTVREGIAERLTFKQTQIKPKEGAMCLLEGRVLQGRQLWLKDWDRSMPGMLEYRSGKQGKRSEWELWWEAGNETVPNAKCTVRWGLRLYAILWKTEDAIT